MKPSKNNCMLFAALLAALLFLPTAVFGSESETSNSDYQDLTAKIAVDAFGKPSVERFEQMIKTGEFDFDCRSAKNKGNLLQYAAMTGDLNRVKEFLKLGADLNVKDMNNTTVLHYAAASGNLQLVEFLVEQGLDCKAINMIGRSVLHYAAQSGNLKLVERLVEQGLDVNAKDMVGSTVLMFAAWSGNLELVQWLVEQGLFINAWVYGLASRY